MIIPRIETIRVYRGRPLLLGHHMARLCLAPFDQERCEQQILSACAPEVDCVVRLTWPDLLMEVRPLPDDLESRLRGVHCVSAPAGLRRPTPELKTPDVAASRAARAFAAERAPAPSEALLGRGDGTYTEGAFTNLLWRMGQSLFAPTEDALPGVARRRLLEVAAAVGLVPQPEARATAKILHSADAVYVSSAVVEVAPVASLDGLALRMEAPWRLDAWRAAYREPPEMPIRSLESR